MALMVPRKSLLRQMRLVSPSGALGLFEANGGTFVVAIDDEADSVGFDAAVGQGRRSCGVRRGFLDGELHDDKRGGGWPEQAWRRHHGDARGVGPGVAIGRR